MKIMIQPAGHRVLIKPDPIEERTKSGIVVLATEEARIMEQAAQITGVIVEVGFTAWKAYDDGVPWARVGDRVFYAKFAGKEVTDPDTKEKFIIVNDEDITGVLV